MIASPIDLDTIRKRLRHDHYPTSAAFLADLRQMADNASRYNGPAHVFTLKAEEIYVAATAAMEAQKAQLRDLEGRITAERDPYASIDGGKMMSAPSAPYMQSIFDTSSEDEGDEGMEEGSLLEEPMPESDVRMDAPGGDLDVEYI